MDFKYIQQGSKKVQKQHNGELIHTAELEGEVLGSLGKRSGHIGEGSGVGILCLKSNFNSISGHRIPIKNSVQVAH